MNIDPLNNKPISPREFRLKKILLIAVLIIFTIAVGFLIYEIHVVKTEGGECVSNPMAWAEKMAYKKEGVMVDCGCNIISELNKTEFNRSIQLNSETENG